MPGQGHDTENSHRTSQGQEKPRDKHHAVLLSLQSPPDQHQSEKEERFGVNELEEQRARISQEQDQRQIGRRLIESIRDQSVKQGESENRRRVADDHSSDQMAATGEDAQAESEERKERIKGAGANAMHIPDLAQEKIMGSVPSGEMAPKNRPPLTRPALHHPMESPRIHARAENGQRQNCQQTNSLKTKQPDI